MLATGTVNPAPHKTLVGWWNVQGRRFVVAAALTAVALVVAGWMSGLRHVMHGALLTLAVAALLPFIVLAAAVLVILLVGLVLALTAAAAGSDDAPGLDGVGEVVIGGAQALLAPYYRFLGRQRHPVFWGVPAGLLLGGLLLWALMAALVLPGETRTVRALTEAKAAIERIHDQSGQFPRPDDRGQLPVEGLGHDGFGRPLKYEVSGRWMLASWTLTSLGFDGKPSDDDLCVAGSTRLRRWADKAAHLGQLLDEITSGRAALDHRLAGVRALRCRQANPP
jgi:hypothetical protein